jgi:hypothetical protein
VGKIGLPGSIPASTQAGGRAVRQPDQFGIYVIFYEPWAADGEIIKLNDFDNEFGSDPDRPRTILTEHSSRQERAGFAPIRLIQCVAICLCIRKFLRDYFCDTSRTGKCIHLLIPRVLISPACNIALEFNGPYCCDRHNDGFNLQDYLPGPLHLHAADAQIIILPPPPPPARNQYRSTASQAVLIPLLTDWRRTEHMNDPLRAVCPEFEILSDTELKLVARWKPNSITLSGSDKIAAELKQTKEWQEVWGTKLFRVLFEFDLENPVAVQRPKRKTPAAAPENTSPIKRPRLIRAAPKSPPRTRLFLRIPPLKDITNYTRDLDMDID